MQVELGDFVDLLEGFFCFRFDLFFGELFVVELDDFLDGARAGAEIFADLQKFFQNQRSARDRFQDEELAALDALGDGNFAFAREQRNRAHFAQVHANGIVGFFERTGSEVEFAVFRSGGFLFYHDSDFRPVGTIGCGQSGLCARQVFVDVNAVTLEGGEQIVNFFRGMHLGRQNIVHFIVEQVTAFLAHRDELSYLIVFFFKSQTHTSSIAR